MEPCHINVGIFKVHETLGATMAIQLKVWLFIMIFCKKF
jgi:hypothetical protein